MRTTITLTLWLSLFAFLSLSLASSAEAQDLPQAKLDNWHHWRGPNADGTAPRGDPPTEWSESKNIQWKVKIPGLGSATPVVWKNKIFVLTAVKTDKQRKGEKAPEENPRRGGRRRRRQPPTHFYKFVVLCLDRTTGEKLWERVANEAVPHEAIHSTSTFASCSPTTDGKHLYASFGSFGVYCYDLDGKLKWKRDLGKMRTRNQFGEGTSPVIHGDSLIHCWDHEGDSSIYCLDAKSGKNRWHKKRNEPTTWDTPLIVKQGRVTQVVANGSRRTRSYNLANGKVIWECGGQAANPIACPVAANGVVYCMTGHRGFAVIAIRLDSRGDVTKNSKKVVWKRNDSGPYVASPLLYDGLLYYTKSRNAILSCVDAKTGEPHYDQQRLPGLSALYASLVGAAGRVYVTGRNGTTLVLKHGKELEVLATNKLDEGIDASPVIVGKQLFLRGQHHLYCISEKRSY